MSKKWMPPVAGILEILAGFMMLASASLYLMMLHVAARVPWVGLSFAVILAGFLGMLPLVGGVCALLRRRWRLAFVGTIPAVALFLIVPETLGRFADLHWGIAQHYSFALSLLLSIAPITLIVLSKREFK